MAFAVANCTEEEIVEDKVLGKPGEDVQFGLSLDNGTRTVYGPKANNAFPIYWSDGDKVQIYSPECVSGRNNAEYSVTPKSGQSYAEELTKTGDYGVQWGKGYEKTVNGEKVEGFHDFYSVYPSLNAAFSGSGSDVTAKLNISSTQTANLSGSVAADMDNVIMYAQTNGVQSGDIVNLQYTPYSTILQFKVAIGQSNNGWGRVKISSLTLTAPEDVAIAGDFKLKFNGDKAPTISADVNNSNSNISSSITMSFETAPILNESNPTANINFALIPLDVTDLTSWTVSLDVYVNDNTTVSTYTKKLDGASNLKPGMIHEIILPTIIPDVAWTYDPSNWITSLYDYKNIYMTELSLPGAWYAGAPVSDEGYQATGSISDLWANGVRAFAVECRTSSSNNPFSNYGVPNNLVISGTGRKLTGTSAYTGGTSISSLIKSIADEVAATVKERKDEDGETILDDDGNIIYDGEFAVLVLSYADGGDTGHRNEDHAYFINGIKTEISESGATNIYNKEIEGSTTVADVLGKLIIKINVDDNSPIGSYAGDANMSLSYNPFLKDLKPAEGQTLVDYTQILFSKVYFKKWADNLRTTTDTNSDDFFWCFSSSNRTQVNTGTDTSIPTYAQRQTALRAMIARSHEITNAGNHNVWFYFNAGGIQATSLEASTSKVDAQTFANAMNAWLYDVIDLKSNGGVDTEGNYTGTAGTIVQSDPSPLGIVMFNQCTNSTYKGPDIIKAIIDMNDKFKLQRYNPNPDPDNNITNGN